MKNQKVKINNTTLNIRINELLKFKIDQFARYLGMDTSTFVRIACNNWIKHISKQIDMANNAGLSEQETRELIDKYLK